MSSSSSSSAKKSAVRSVERLGFPFATLDPFLFAVYHKDLYPAGNASNMNAPTIGNGADFDWNKPYRMYHGDTMPGFPQHPHRGFETITLVQSGRCDHTDSLGQAGRYGGDGRRGDLQWMTAGKGCVHGEMFPLINTATHNHLHLFQIWINLPARSKMCTPGYVMFWAEQMKFISGSNGAECEVAAGRLGDVVASGVPPADSWGAEERNDVGVFLINLPPGSSFTLPAAKYGAEVNRVAYCVEGPKAKDGAAEDAVKVDGTALGKDTWKRVELHADVSAVFESSAKQNVQFLVLQGRPIKEPVAQSGPFVMNTQAELMQAYRDYQSTQFGGWPWDEDAVAFPRSEGRFALRMVGGKLSKEFPPTEAADSKEKDASKEKAAQKEL